MKDLQKNVERDQKVPHLRLFSRPRGVLGIALWNDLFFHEAVRTLR